MTATLRGHYSFERLCALHDFLTDSLIPKRMLVPAKAFVGRWSNDSRGFVSFGFREPPGEKLVQGFPSAVQIIARQKINRRRAYRYYGPP